MRVVTYLYIKWALQEAQGLMVIRQQNNYWDVHV